MATVEKLPMLAEGQKMLLDEAARLKAERPLVIDAIEEARAHGDLSENAEYHAAKERQGQIEAMIAERQAVRQRRDFAKSDEIRKKLAESGIILEDSKDGSVRWRV